jgi:hypothetical protein
MIGVVQAITKAFLQFLVYKSGQITEPEAVTIYSR